MGYSRFLLLEIFKLKVKKNATVVKSSQNRLISRNRRRNQLYPFKSPLYSFSRAIDWYII